MQTVIDFFQNPFFQIYGGIMTILSVLGLGYIIFSVIKGTLPVWYRLGMGLSKRNIAIFADREYNNLESLLIDSKIFKKKRIIQLNDQSIKKAESINLLLAHWLYVKDHINEILLIKKDSAALIIYAPQDEGAIEKELIKKINRERNVIIVNFRGRLLNDILTSMITTSYE